MKNSLNALAAALSMGLIWAVSLFIFTLVCYKTGFGGNALHLIEDVYPWYSVSVQGAFIGLVWGFLDVFIGAYIFVLLYNFFNKKLGK